MSTFAIWVIGIVIVIIFLIWLEWQIGKAIGKRVSKSTGLVLGILGIVICPFIVGGIACIVYSSKNTDVITVNIPDNADHPNPASASGDDTRECPYCAEIIKKKATICRFCGKEIEADSSQQTAESPGRDGAAATASSAENSGAETRKRHGFTTFWLIFNSVLTSFLSLGGFWVSTLFIFAFILITIVATVLLLRWKKRGFWCLLISIIVYVIYLFAAGLDYFYSFSRVIPLLVPFAITVGVLRLRNKDGKTTWEQLR